MSEIELAQIITDQFAIDDDNGTDPELLAEIIYTHGFRKPRVDRERLVEAIRAYTNNPECMNPGAKSYGARSAVSAHAPGLADAILALLSPPEVETPRKPELRKYTHEEMNELDRQRGIDIIDD